MGQSTNAMLVYGYHLGSGDGGWLVEGVGEYGELPDLPWLDEDNEDGGDFQESAERRLLAEIAGFTETWSSGGEGYHQREREAKGRLGVEFDTHCSGDYPMYLLIAKGITVYRGSAEALDLAALATEPEMSGWDEKLRAALTALGITPTQERAQWLLCSYWG